MRSKKKRFNKKIIIILLIIICICVAMVAATLVFAKYKLTLTTTHSIESTHFYFESDLADTEDKNYYIISTDSNINEEIEFYVRNYTNDTLYSDEDITYTISAIAASSDITVKVLDETDAEISDSQTLTGKQVSLSNYKIQVVGNENFTESKSFDITLTISSNAPYEKTLTSTITVSNTIAENEVSLDVSSNEEYATLSIIVNVLADITISYDSSNLTVDQNSLSSNMEDDLDGTISVSSGGMTLGETYNIIFIISGGNSDISIENGDVKVE